MPFVDLQSRLGINLDRWLLLQSGEQPNKRAARCHAFEKEWIECSHGIGQTRAKKECQLEFEDFYECMHRQKTIFSRAVMFWGCRRATRTFNSRHRFSMGLRSGDWLGHSRTFKCFLRSHSFVARAVCFGSLSCWKTQPRFIFKV
uniref:NADH dehydrogenase [ubiquinone] iron-sulfur protein 5 n=1 Tax=Astatotilapia calliptera TaxID=8154 RepID=A0AAX7UCT8_ASTCA